MKPIITVKDLSKKYSRRANSHLAYGVSDLWREIFGKPPSLSLRKDEFMAVDDVSFNLFPGDTFALIGRNGSGKTTILKMMSGLTKPDGGSIDIKGKVQALINLGAGFNPNLSGHDNIYNSAALMGLSRRETRGIVDEVVDFSELEEFIDSPVGTYSSGMKSRLGFSVAVSLKPDILLIDEILSVGDYAFQNRCFARMQQLKKQGVTIVLVSHAHNSVIQLCQRAMWLHKGRVMHVGLSKETVQAYLGFLEQEEAAKVVLRNQSRIERALVKHKHTAKDAPKTESEGSELVTDISFRDWNGELPVGLRAIGATPPKPAQSDDGRKVLQLTPAPPGKSSGLDCVFHDGESLLGRMLLVRVEAKTVETGKLGVNLYYELDGKRKAFSKSHPGNGEWVLLTHEVDIPPSADPGSIRLLISLRSGAEHPALIDNVTAVLMEEDFEVHKGKKAPAEDPYDGLYGPIFDEFDNITDLSVSFCVDGRETDKVRVHDRLVIGYSFTLLRHVEDLNITLKFFRKDGLILSVLSTLNGDLLKDINSGKVDCAIEIPDFDFNPASYILVMAVHEGRSYLYRNVIREFAVMSGDTMSWGIRDFRYSCRVNSKTVYDTTIPGGK